VHGRSFTFGITLPGGVLTEYDNHIKLVVERDGQPQIADNPRWRSEG